MLEQKNSAFGARPENVKFKPKNKNFKNQWNRDPKVNELGYILMYSLSIF